LHGIELNYLLDFLEQGLFGSEQIQLEGRQGVRPLIKVFSLF
jgi:hypothetical protein